MSEAHAPTLDVYGPTDIHGKPFLPACLQEAYLCCVTVPLRGKTDIRHI